MTVTTTDPVLAPRPAAPERRRFPRTAVGVPARPLLTHAPRVDRAVDLHTHSLLGRGRSSPLEMADAAVAAGLTTWALTDHVTAEDTWVVEYAAMVRGLRREGLTVRCGVETTVLDQRGHLDLTGRLPFLDHAVVTVVDLPGRSGPQPVAEVRAALAAGRLGAADVVDALVTATVAAVRNVPARPVVGRLGSPLRALDIDDALVGDDHLHAIAAACRVTGGVIEVNERWQAPSARIATWFAAAGISLVAGSDATTPAAVGRWRHVERLTGTETPDLADLLAFEEFPTTPGVTEASSSGTK